MRQANGRIAKGLFSMRSLNLFSPASAVGPLRPTGVRAAAEHHAFSQGLTPGGPGWGDAIRDFVLNGPPATSGDRNPNMPGRASAMQQQRFEPEPVDRGRPEPSFEDEWQALLAAEGGVDEHGNPKTSRKGAIGPAQIMTQYGPAYAKRAGLDWDEHRARKDNAYNLALGRGYYAWLRHIYDAPTAAAAYNRGPYEMSNIVGRAVGDGHPEDWTRSLPAETRGHVRKFMDLLGLPPVDLRPANKNRKQGRDREPTRLTPIETDPWNIESVGH
jgi:hypothetical protein